MPQMSPRTLISALSILSSQHPHWHLMKLSVWNFFELSICEPGTNNEVFPETFYYFLVGSNDLAIETLEYPGMAIKICETVFVFLVARLATHRLIITLHWHNQEGDLVSFPHLLKVANYFRRCKKRKIFDAIVSLDLGY